MEIIAVSVCIIIALCACRIEKNIYNPCTIFCGLWGVICLFASFRFWGLYSGSDLTYVLIIFGMTSFGLGCIISKNCRVVIGHHGGDTRNNSEKRYEFRMGLLRFLCVLSVIMLIYPTIMTVQRLLFQGYTMSTVRASYEMEYENIVLKLIYNYIVLPFSFAISPIYATLICMNVEKDKIVKFSSVFIILARLVTEAGRAIVLYFLLSVVFALIIAKQKDRVKKKLSISLKRGMFKYIFIIGIAAVVVLVATNARLESDYSTWEHAYIYLCGCIPHLSERLDMVNASGVCTFGATSCFGFLQFAFTMLENLGLSYPKFMTTADTWLESVLSYVDIGSDLPRFNAFTGPFYHMYLDGRIPGVIILMLIYGAVSYSSYKGVINRPNSRNFPLFLLIIQGLIFSFVRIQFAVMHYCLAFFMIFVVTRPIREELPHRTDDFERTRF